MRGRLVKIPDRGHGKLKGPEAEQAWSVSQFALSFSICIPALLPLWAEYTPYPRMLRLAKWLCFDQRSLSRCDMSRGLKCACAVGLPSWACALPREEHALRRWPSYWALKRSHMEQTWAQTAKKSQSSCIFSLKQNLPAELRLDQLIRSTCKVL